MPPIIRVKTSRLCESSQTDRSSIGLLFADKETITHRVVTSAAVNHRFEIPRREANHRVVARKTFRRDTYLFSLFPHMHMRGKSFRYVLLYPGQQKKWESKGWMLSTSRRLVF